MEMKRIILKFLFHKVLYLLFQLFFSNNDSSGSNDCFITIWAYSYKIVTQLKKKENERKKQERNK